MIFNSYELLWKGQLQEMNGVSGFFICLKENEINKRSSETYCSKVRLFNRPER